MKKVILFLLVFSAIGLTDTSAQLKMSGIELPATLKAGDKDISLNGGGIRSKWFFDIYVGGLYLMEKSGDANAIIAADKPMGIRLNMVSGLISSEKMSTATKEGFKKSTGDNTTSIQAEIDKFIAIFNREQIGKTDIFDIVYIPGTGVTVIKNGKLQDTIEGLAFKKALFGIWLCDDPADDDLKDGMLGK